MFTFFSWLFTNQISQLFVYKILFCLLLYKYTYNLKRILSVCFHILVRMIYISNICELLPPWIYEFWTTTYNYNGQQKIQSFVPECFIHYLKYNHDQVNVIHNFTQRSNMKGKKNCATIFDSWLWFYSLYRKKYSHMPIAIQITIHTKFRNILPIEKSIYIIISKRQGTS